MIKMIAVDMDGTFLKATNEYNRQRFAKIYAEALKQDVKFVVASGNQYFQLKSFFPEIAQDISFVAENGALVISEEQELFCGQMSLELVRRVLSFIDELPEVQTILCGRQSAYIAEKERQAFVEHAGIFYHRLAVVPDLKTLDQDVFFKFALNGPEEKTVELMALFNDNFAGEITAVTSGHGDIDLIIPGLHKANGLSLLQAKWDIATADIVSFGDGGNDKEMLAYTGHSFAMENGSQVAKEAAKALAPSNQDEGVLVVLEKLLGLSD
ncbi:Cof-type HAD-IIB family hydrolase [Vagococcus salmoninarum]|uniref:Cof-type HAD-IIB family hydrolase n=1 Tax=Vagococcus salmoninarum TaxID=2739 RepID=UPI0028D88713|nr:Cof-type HAD-IIB family hydrolase [Vagococcus salmoninarum]